MALWKNYAAFDARIVGDASANVITVDDSAGATEDVYVDGNLVGTFDSSSVLLLEGLAGNDEIYSAGGNDILSGGEGDDLLVGNAGNDMLNGGLGSDTMRGGFGNDIYRVNLMTDIVTEDELQGQDTVIVNNTSYTLSANVEDMIIVTGAVDGTGNLLDNDITGSRLANTLWGNDGNDSLYGRAGGDTLYGGSGNDSLYGGRGTDDHYGGAGADTFTFQQLDDSRAGQVGADTIQDFSQAELDIINLLKIDADTSTGFNDAFTWIGKATFSGTAGELRYTNNGDITYVRGDVDGDGSADFTVALIGHYVLTESDFVL